MLSPETHKMPRRLCLRGLCNLILTTIHSLIMTKLLGVEESTREFSPISGELVIFVLRLQYELTSSNISKITIYIW